ncbi:hypothetical protein SOASR030_04840 [Leminorella grimontii]|uniref:Uncharacterized protein n=1 Tax=Leminorella grimontii TaxID=82981 RepID=A0AAV5N124_9GAMM|nr:hypothetical protein [Leminorella grimontii]KFC96439.1 hypothetical protein GLGR_1615 [Leminorella grimontii ATCC 33999 = DSM 5078]GKX54372.1 hypothetical protein SOASR030_04840 [Leminorella grimontii]GKX57791.1 hypothetical protein SOASR031_01060 [Leminorella grimontii]VFS59460.1 Uncharacterised protein [Leminorella grimontii]
MNYQSAGIFVYSATLFFKIIIAVALSFIGIGAPLCYLVIVGLMLPVALSLRLHQLKEKGVATVPPSESDWTVYTYGGPIREKRSTLMNPCFFDEESARRFFLFAFIAKFAVQVTAMAFLGIQTLRIGHWVIDAISAVIFLSMLYSAVKTAYGLFVLIKRRQEMELYTSDSGSQWYRGYISWRGRRNSLLALMNSTQ